MERFLQDLDKVGREGGGKRGRKTRLMGRKREGGVCTGKGLRFIAELKAHTIVRPG